MLCSFESNSIVLVFIIIIIIIITTHHHNHYIIISIMKIRLTKILLNCNSDFPKICAWFESSCFAAPILNSTVSTSCTAQLLNWNSEFLFLLKTKARMAASSLLSLLRFSIQVYFTRNLKQQRGNRN